MTSTRHDLLNRMLIAGARELDLTPTQHARAVGHYEAVGEYLAERGVGARTLFTDGVCARVNGDRHSYQTCRPG